MPRERLEHYQVWLYLLALALGIGIGFAFPGGQALFETAIWAALGGLLYTMFLQVPLTSLRQALRQRRFMLALLVANFLLVPVVVWLLTRLLPPDRPMLLGVFLVLLTPCIDYVIAFTQLGRGDERLTLAATPLLLLAQMLCLPVYLRLFLGPDAVAVMSAEPFLQAFIRFIVVPLGLALATELWTQRSPAGKRWTAATGWLPVPLMGLTLLLVVAAQAPQIVEALPRIYQVVPVYVAFLVIMPFISQLMARVFNLDSDASRALVFSASTRNSLVVLPLALALPNGWELTPAVIVMQTCVELLGLLVYVRVIPLFIPQPKASGHTTV